MGLPKTLGPSSPWARGDVFAGLATTPLPIPRWSISSGDGVECCFQKIDCSHELSFTDGHRRCDGEAISTDAGGQHYGAATQRFFCDGDAALGIVELDRPKHALSPHVGDAPQRAQRF